MPKTKAPDPQLLAARSRAEHAEKQRDDLALALREVLDAHYHWRLHGEGNEGPEADQAAQRFIDARNVAAAALSMAPEGTAAAVAAVNARVMGAAREAYSHIGDHDHEGLTRENHFFGTFMERLGLAAS